MKNIETEKNIYLDIGKTIKHLRKIHKTKQSELAEILGVQPSTLTNYENGHRKIPVEHLATIAQHFNISLDGMVKATPKNIKTIVMWEKELPPTEFTDKEIKELINYAHYLIYKRETL